MDGENGWWTTSGNIRLPPLAKVMGVGRQQHESRFSGRNSDVSSKIIGNGHTLDRDSDLEEEIQHDSDAETIIDDSYVTNRPGPFNNNIDLWTYNLHDLPDITFVNIDNYGVTDRQSVVKFRLWKYLVCFLPITS